MRKTLLALLAFALLFRAAAQNFARPSTAVIDDNYRTYVNNLFGQLEPARVSTGLLMDYAVDFTDPKFYNGTVLHDSTLMEPGVFSELYQTLYTGQFSTADLGMRHPDVHDSLWHVARQREVITLSGLLFKYNAILPDANTTGKMQTVNGKLYDVYNNGVWQNPYAESKTVAISPSIITYKLTYCSVVLPSNLWLGNMNGEISSLQFDADDGQGYRSLQFDVPLSLNYADTGWKHWVFRVTLTNNQQLYSHAKVHFSNESNAAGSGGALARGVIDRRRTVIATESYKGEYGIANILIGYRNANDKVIRKPLIIVEGFDPGHILSPEEPEGSSTFDGFIRSVRTSGSTSLRNLISGTDVFDPNSPSEYDIIYVDWVNGTDYLQRNALALEEVIRFVNAVKQPLNGVRQPNVVLGSSMGGVIARMAIGRMDRAGGLNAHETRLYISLDAPHQGANVPLGYQAAARHARNIYVRTGPLFLLSQIIVPIVTGISPRLALRLADQPAARQLLVQRMDFGYDPDNGEHQQFMQELRTQWGYPDAAHTRSIAISNGSECAIDQEFAAGSPLLYHYRSVKTRFIGDLLVTGYGALLGTLTGGYSLLAIPLTIPGSNKFELTLDIKALANGGGNQVYYGNIKLTKKVLWLVPVGINVANKSYTAPSGLLPLDTYPGSFYTVSIDNLPSSVSQDRVFSYDASFFIQRRFAFIHTTSSLDVGSGNATIGNAEYLTKYIGGAPPAAPLNSPFQNFTTAFNENPITIIRRDPVTNSIVYQFTSIGDEPHEGLYFRSANWLATEINRATPADPIPQTNCSAFCDLVSGKITGDEAVVCNTTYSVPNLAGVTYIWSTSSNLTINGPITNPDVQVTPNAVGGSGWVQVSITTACGTIVKRRNVTLTDYSEAYVYNEDINIQVIHPPEWNVGAYRWYMDGVFFRQTNAPLLKTTLVNQCHYWSVSFVTACGESPETYPIDIGCGNRAAAAEYSTNPNPVQNNTITVSRTTKPPAKAAETVRIYLHDFQTGGTMRQWKFANMPDQQPLNVSGLKKGKYILVITRGSYRQSQQMIIE